MRQSEIPLFLAEYHAKLKPQASSVMPLAFADLLTWAPSKTRNHPVFMSRDTFLQFWKHVIVRFTSVSLSKKKKTTTKKHSSLASFLLWPLYQVTVSPPHIAVSTLNVCFASPFQIYIPLYFVHKMDSLRVSVLTLTTLWRIGENGSEPACPRGKWWRDLKGHHRHRDRHVSCCFWYFSCFTLSRCEK